MDSAEAWLAEHDPDYAETKQDWKHIGTGQYVQPSQEAAWDENEHGPVADLIDQGKAKRVGAAQRKKCGACADLFAPAWSHQEYCSEKCRKRVENKRLRQGKNEGGI
jgi:hypothetical protein